MDRKAIIDAVIGVEGGYSNDPNDPGGPTRWGITERIARLYGYQGDMKAYPRESAVSAFEQEFWFRPRIDSIATVNEKVAEEVFECGVNISPAKAITFLQQCLNAFSLSSMDDLKVDGVCGQATIDRLAVFLKMRPTKTEAAKVILTGLNALQGEYYIVDLANHADLARRRKYRTFVYGWVKNRVLL